MVLPVNTPETIVVPMDRTPTLANENVIDGAILGHIIGGDAVSAVTGGVIGSIYGKDKMERQHNEGRPVSKPFSKAFHVTVGVLIGAAAAAILAGGMLATAPVTFGLVVAAAATVSGAISGVAQENREKDYEAAQNYYLNHGGNYRGRAVETASSLQVTVEESALLNARLAAMQGRTHVGRAGAPSITINER